MRIATLSLTLVLLAAAAHQSTTSPKSPRPGKTATTAPENSKPAKIFRDCPECPEMIVVAAGSFMMGSPENEPDRDAIEGPQRRVTIRKFAVGKFDITRAQWASFAAATNRTATGGCAWAGPAEEELDPTMSWRKLGFPQDDTHPVVCVTWQDAQDYVHWLRQRTGKKYRLLSEAEWEYSARAGTATAYPWGVTASHDHSNYGADECCSGLAKGQDQWEKTSPVGSFPPNGFGLHDMHGNVLQWVQDCLAISYSGLPSDGSPYEKSIPLNAPGPFPPAEVTGTNSCSYRMVRGGDWGDPPKMIRSAFRNYGPGPGATLENYRSAGVGFRVAQTLD